ncbi:MAG: hypothetical protein LQ352_005386, partial [Teloschistes flavicans]
MTTTSHPPSSSLLAIPTTQNTAPVLSYSCLYTHDLRRKAKRWQDGVLRFHTFNKRVMVYDVLRNFIGDTHWREPQAIQDGDELELEKGVLLQVGEELERTETDLTELLNKRKAKPTLGGEGSSAQDGAYLALRNQPSSTCHHAVEGSASAQASQLRPKSLNALLGKNRGPVGRAALPTQSPADRRKGKENHDLDKDARSPKRRRLRSPINSTPSAPSAKARGMQLLLPSVKDGRAPISTSGMPQVVESQVPVIIGKRPSIPNRPGLAKGRQDVRLHQPLNDGSLRKRGSNRSSDAIPDASPDIEDHVRPRKGTQRSNAEVYISSNPATEEVSRHLKACEQMTTTVPTSDAALGNRRLLAQVVNVDSDERNKSLDSEAMPTNLLCIASTKPRKKLMYKDLLPQEVPPAVRQARSLKEVSNRSSRPTTSSTREGNKRQKPPLDDFHEAQRGRLQDRLSRFNKTSKIASKVTTILDQEEVDENLSGRKKALSTEGNDDPNFPESLFLTQLSADESVPEAEKSATNCINLLNKQTELEANLDAHAEHVPSSQPQLTPASSDMGLSNNSQTKQQPDAREDETANARSSGPNANPQEELVLSTPPRRTRTSLDPDIPLPQDTEQQLAPRQRDGAVDDPTPRYHAIIKAALPPPQQRTSRPFQRSVSDVSAYAAAKPRESNGFTKPSGLRRHLSAETANINTGVAVPSRPPRIRTTNLYASSDGVRGLNKKLPTPREQVADPWSWEA